MPIAITTEPQEYVLKAERELPVEKQTVFLLKPLSARAQMRIQDRAKQSATETVTVDGKEYPALENRFEVAYERVLASLTGWRNFYYPDGKEVTFDPRDRECNLDKIELIDLFELSLAIDKLSSLDEGAVKN